MAKAKNKAKKVLRDWDIGSSSAENDINLSHYFYEEWLPYKKAIAFENNIFFLKGRTGSGKSAILSRIREEFANDHDVVIADISPDEFFLSKYKYLDEITEFTKATNHPEFAYKILWNLVISGECINAIRKYGCDELSRVPRLANNIAYSFLKDAGLLSSSSLKMTDKVLNLLRKIKPAISFKKGDLSLQTSIEFEKDDSISALHALVRDCREIIEKIIPELLGARSMYILIDDLDLGWENDDSDNILLRSLATCLIRFSRIDQTIKPLAAIRTNIFGQIGMYQTEKITDYILDCQWDKISIKEVILKRLAHKFNIEKEIVWNKLFDDRVSIGIERKKKTFDFLFERTLGRPRDMIMLVTECLRIAVQNDHYKTTKDDIIEATAKYSGERAESLIQEWRFNYPSLSFIFNLFAVKDEQGELKIKYEYDEMWDRLAHGFTYFEDKKQMKWYYSYIDGDDMTQLILLLFELGILTIRTSANQPVRASFDIGNKRILPSLNSTFYISPCFRSHLETLLPVF